MKKYTAFLLITAIMVSCNSKKQDQQADVKDSSNINILPDSTAVLKDAHYLWAVDEENLRGLSMKKTRPISSDSLTAANILELLNSTYPEIPLSLVKTSGDTIFIKINKSDYLTRQIGSTGAEGYLAELTYDLTEINGVNYVDVRFKKGDHAEPGTYTRTDFVR